MKRYMVFLYPKYYPSGGMGDYWDSFDTLEEIIPAILKELPESNAPEYGDIFDLETKTHIKTLEQPSISYPYTEKLDPTKPKWFMEDVE